MQQLHTTVKKERALLVVIKTQDETWSREDLSLEFKNLVESTSIEIANLVSANLHRPTPNYFIGKGKVEELVEEVEDLGVDVVIFDNNLNSNQQRNLEDALGVKVIDRTQLILDIFAKHAQTQEGILQVELAQLEYLLPRLRGKGIMLSRLGGGIGTRGPGEKKLEVDRRKISDKISHLKKEIEKVKQHRDVIRKKRKRQRMRVCSLVGYTNAGKTTLFNALTQSQQVTSSALFTTLDTVTRTLDFDNNISVIVSDTVGFIYKLPPNLVDAFKATLEELHYADILLHVIDASNKNINQIKSAVDKALAELDLGKKPLVVVFNKIDQLNSQEVEVLRGKYPEASFICATKGIGIDELKQVIYENLFKDIIEVVVKVPFDMMDLSNYLHNNCEVLKTNYSEKEAIYWLRISKDTLKGLEKRGLKPKEV